jgi:hypothetical protein
VTLSEAARRREALRAPVRTASYQRERPRLQCLPRLSDESLVNRNCCSLASRALQHACDRVAATPKRQAPAVVERLPECIVQMSKIGRHPLKLSNVSFAEQFGNSFSIRCHCVSEYLIAQCPVCRPIRLSVSLQRLCDPTEVARIRNARIAHIGL